MTFTYIPVAPEKNCEIYEKIIRKIVGHEKISLCSLVAIEIKAVQGFSKISRLIQIFPSGDRIAISASFAYCS
jgi:hypothetical protein